MCEKRILNRIPEARFPIVIDAVLLAAGLLLDYSSTSQGDASSSSMLVGPVVRYYMGESGIWGQLSYGIGSSKKIAKHLAAEKLLKYMDIK